MKSRGCAQEKNGQKWDYNTPLRNTIFRSDNHVCPRPFIKPTCPSSRMSWTIHIHFAAENHIRKFFMHQHVQVLKWAGPVKSHEWAYWLTSEAKKCEFVGKTEQGGTKSLDWTSLAVTFCSCVCMCVPSENFSGEVSFSNCKCWLKTDEFSCPLHKRQQNFQMRISCDRMIGRVSSGWVVNFQNG